MKVSLQGLIALIAHEGIVPAPYKDSVGVWTYGIGHTKAAGAPDPALMARGMPADLDAALAEVFALFRKDIAKYEADVARAVKVPLKQHQFDALVSFHYNTGAIGRASLVKALNAGDFAGAARGFMAWVKPKEITARRRDEQRLFADGVYPAHAATVWRVTDAGKVIWKPARKLSPADVMALLGDHTRIIATMPARTAEAVQDHSVDATEKVAPAVNPVGPVVAIGGALAVAAAAFWDKVQHWIGGLLP